VIPTPFKKKKKVTYDVLFILLVFFVQDVLSIVLFYFRGDSLFFDYYSFQVFFFIYSNIKVAFIHSGKTEGHVNKTIA